MRNVRQLPLVVSLMVCAVVFLAVLGLRRVGSLEPFELAAYDWYLRHQPRVSTPHADLVLIKITEDDIRRQGQWPISDGTLTRALTILIDNGARAIGVDIYREIPVPPGSDRLDELLGANAHLIVVTKFGEGEVPPPKAVHDPDQVAFNDILVDADGTVRRGLLFLDDGEKVVYSLAVRLALARLQADGLALRPDDFQPEVLRLGPTTVPPLEPNDGPYVNADPRGYQFLIDFRETPEAFPSYTLSALLSGAVDAGMIHGRVALLGVTAQSVKDFFPVPYNRSLRPDELVSGITLHAHMASQVLRWGRGESGPLKTAAKPFNVLWLLLWTVSGAAVGWWVRRPWAFVLVSLACLGGLGLAGYAAMVAARWLPVAAPELAWLLSTGLVKAYASYHESKERALLMEFFARHVSPRVAELLWREREHFTDGGRPRSQQLFATVLFADLEGFTRATEQLSPQLLTDWLNAYLEAMARVIMDHDGSVDNYAGDGIKADFGVPLARTTEDEIKGDALSAVKCALAMGDEIVTVNDLWRRQGLPTARLRIGINSGQVMAGTFGSMLRLKYTTHGDTVNTASRLEGYKKDAFEWEGGSLCRILIGEATLRLINQQFVVRKVGEVILKGKNVPVGVYQVLGTAADS